MIDDQHHIQLTVPEQDLERLSFCETKPAKVAEWVSHLPLVNLGETTKKLYAALPEIARVKVSPKDRLAMLEALYPCVTNSIAGLTSHFLNQPIILPDHQLKIATLAQALQKHLTTGYKQVINDFDHVDKLNKQERSTLLPTAIERALSGSGRILLRCFQLYVPLPQKLWYEIHQLYRLAAREDLLNSPVQNPLNLHRKDVTVLDAYLRTLLMGTIRPNQLRQMDLDQTYQALELWTPLVYLDETPCGNLHAVRLNEDSAPVYVTQLIDANSPTCRHINTKILVAHILKALRENKRDDVDPPIPHGLSINVLEHLITNWSVQKKRSFDRISSDMQLTVCIGLRDFHYFLADQTPFNFFTLERGKGIVPNNDNLFLNNRLNGTELRIMQDDDVWEKVLDAGKGITSSKIKIKTDSIENQLLEQEKDKEKQKHHECIVNIVNTSPGGFCLEWTNAIPQQVKAGEILGIKEDNRQNWSVGIIRWVRQVGGKKTHCGVELLSPTAVPYGAALITTKGVHTEYMRALMLPELTLINQAATLITTQLPFQVGHKVKLNQYGSERVAHLTKRIITTGSINQFEFKYLDQAANLANSTPQTNATTATKKNQPSKDKGNDDDDFFNSIWNKL